MKGIFLFLLVILFISTDCAGVLHYQYTRKPVNTGICVAIPVYIDKTFGNQDRLLIDDAINSWNYALNGYIKLEVQTPYFDMDPNIIHGGIVISKVNSSNSFVPLSPDEGIVLGWTDHVSGHYIYLIEDRLQESDYIFRETVRHELGHSLGSGHIKDHPSLMNPSISPYAQCIDYYSMQQVATHYGIEISRLNYCEYD